MTTVVKFYYTRPENGEIMPLGEYAVPAVPRIGECVLIYERKWSRQGTVASVEHVLTPPSAEVRVVLGQYK
jgi:hypothetical protein